ncbi:MAG: MFS transporter, partial [Candidatus Nanopelagicales bacterium]
MVRQIRSAKSTPAVATAKPRARYVVLVSSILARLPQGMAPLAIVLLVQERTHSFADAGLAAGAWALFAAASQPLWARPAGRGNASKVIALTSSSQALVILAIALSDWTSATALVPMAALGGLLAAPTSAVARTLWPQLSKDQHELDSLFTLDATSQELIFIVGPTMVGVLVSVQGPELALFVAASLGVLGGLTFAYVVRPLWSPHPRARDGGALGRPVLVLFSVLMLAALGIGFVEVGVPAAAILAHNRSASGLLLAAWSVGSLVGGVVSSRIHWRGQPADRLAGLLIGLTVGTAVVVASWHGGLAWLGVGLFTAGLTLAPTLAAAYGVIGDV